MVCKKCGGRLTGFAVFCPSCGAAVDLSVLTRYKIKENGVVGGKSSNILNNKNTTIPVNSSAATSPSVNFDSIQTSQDLMNNTTEMKTQTIDNFNGGSIQQGVISNNSMPSQNVENLNQPQTYNVQSDINSDSSTEGLGGILLNLEDGIKSDSLQNSYEDNLSSRLCFNFDTSSDSRFEPAIDINAGTQTQNTGYLSAPNNGNMANATFPSDSTYNDVYSTAPASRTYAPYEFAPPAKRHRGRNIAIISTLSVLTLIIIAAVAVLLYIKSNPMIVIGKAALKSFSSDNFNLSLNVSGVDGTSYQMKGPFIVDRQNDSYNYDMDFTVKGTILSQSFEQKLRMIRYNGADISLDDKGQVVSFSVSSGNSQSSPGSGLGFNLPDNVDPDLLEVCYNNFIKDLSKRDLLSKPVRVNSGGTTTYSYKINFKEILICLVENMEPVLKKSYSLEFDMNALKAGINELTFEEMNLSFDIKDNYLTSVKLKMADMDISFGMSGFNSSSVNNTELDAIYQKAKDYQVPDNFDGFDSGNDDYDDGFYYDDSGFVFSSLNN